jgi:hypothetical protein
VLTAGLVVFGATEPEPLATLHWPFDLGDPATPLVVVLREAGASGEGGDEVVDGR